MPLLFSYGTLRDEAVQLATFGRRLEGRADELVGFERSVVTVSDAAFVRKSGSAEHATLLRTGRPEDRVAGTAFEVTDAELARADAYEPEEYTRIEGALASGARAWVYLAGSAP